MRPAPLRAATRGSALARWQTRHVASLLGVAVDEVIVETVGDRRTDIPLHEIGGRGVFVKEVQAAVLDGRADFAVHSGKDLPSGTVDGLVLACVPERADPRDVLVGQPLASLAPGAVVGTGSVRRRAQLAHLRPDLTFAELRGNIDTRLSKAPMFGAIVMAAAALERLGYEHHIAEILDAGTVIPQVAQGALVVECRAGDADLLALLRSIEHAPSRAAVDAERSFLGALGGGCDLPVAAHAVVEGDGVRLTGMLASLDGRTVLRAADAGIDLEAVGAGVAERLLEQGGEDLLRELRG